MRIKKDYDTVLKERIADVKTLLLYFNVTRVRQYYTKRDGTSEFVLTSWDSDFRFYEACKNKRITRSAANRVASGRLRKAFNEIHDIPFDLLNKVMGWYGSKKRITIADIPEAFDGYKKFDAGKKVYKGEVEDWFCRKWIMEDKMLLRSLLCDPSYDRVDTIPNASKRVIGIIQKWEAENGRFE